MDKIKLVAILRGIQPAEAADHIETLINAGFRYIEIPLNSPDWQQSIPAMVRQFGERAMIGAEVATFSERYRASRVVLVGEHSLSARYQQAMAARGLAVSYCSGEAAFLSGMARMIDGQG